MTSVAEYKKQMLFKRKLKEDPMSAMEGMGGVHDILFKAFKQAAEELVNSDKFVKEVAELAFSKLPKPKDGKDGKAGTNGRDSDDIEVIVHKVVPLVPRARDGRDGKDGKNGRDGRQGERGGEGFPGRDGKDGNEIEGKEIVQKINNLPLEGDKMIDAKHIKNLPQAMGDSTPLFRGGLKMKYGIELEGTINGVNTIFTVPADQPTPKDGKFIISARGVLKNSDSGDFTVSGDNRTITFTSAPPTGSGRPRIELYEAH